MQLQQRPNQIIELVVVSNDVTWYFAVDMQYSPLDINLIVIALILRFFH